MFARVLVYFGAFLVAVLATSVLASVSSTQFVLAGLSGIGVDVAVSERLAMTIADFGILPTLTLAVTACFLIGFPVAALAASQTGAGRRTWFLVAGALALIAELLIMRATLGLMPVAGARTLAGLASQGLAGALGGWLFAALTTKVAARGRRDA